MNLSIYWAGCFGKEVYDVAFRQNEIRELWEYIFFNYDFKENGSDCYLSKVFILSPILEIYTKDNLEVVIATGEPVVRIK